MTILKADRVFKSFVQAGTRIDVLRGLDLEVRDGETLAIAGKSGSGKSTLLSLLAGLDSPSSGEIQLAGKPLAAMSEEELTLYRSKHLGIVFQQFHLMTHLSAIENISLPLEISKNPNALDKARAALESVGLLHRAHHFPHQLSGGEKQRVAIARAIVVEPSLLLADEPSGSLDSATGTHVMELLFDLVNSRGMTLVLVTHNEELVRLCQRRLTLSEGRLQ
jgi:putative ABC transport system ATP-binding protein